MLGLRPTSAPLRPPAAWFLPGAPAEWLEELSRWDDPLAGPILLPVAGQGVLVRLSADTPPSPRAQPYGLLGGKLYLPTCSELNIAVSADELAELPDALLVLHPLAGLVGFRPDAMLAVRDLLDPPPRRPSAWSAARPGEPPWPPLTDVSVLRTISVEQLLDATRGEIGSAPPQELPPEPNEAPASKDPVRWAGGQLARAARWLSGGDPDEARDPSWIDRLERWSKEKREQLRELRARELQRLLGLLERDPDQGLRYALPLGGAGSRGQARPGAKLPPRDLRLDLSSPRGGAPADPWEVDPELFAQLRARYREAANRELNLGRHERAAYIYLELLGDVDAAALALERGRHYREAAELYTERLGRPLDAARCLERGGLLLEAIAIYRTQRRFETAGGLLERLGRRDEAIVSYRRAAAELRADGDVRGAAILLETKIGDPDEALSWLASTWPHGSQASGCLADRFGLLGRLARHDDALRLLRGFLRDGAPPACEAVLVETLAKVSRTYPDEQVRANARDTTRVAAGKQLRHVGPATAERLLRAVARVEPRDELLARDVRRAIGRLRKWRPAKRPLRSSRLKELEWTREFRLPLDVTWEQARQPENVTAGFYAVGQGEQGPVVLRARWGGQLQWRWWFAALSWPANLLLDCSLPAVIVAYEGVPETARLPRVRFPSTEEFPRSRLAETPGWLPNGTLAYSCSSAGLAWAVYPGNVELILACIEFASGGFGVTTQSLFTTPLIATPRITLQTLARQVVVGLGQQLCFRGGRTTAEQVALPKPILRVRAGPGDAPQFTAACEEGATLVRPRPRGVDVLPFAAGMSAPHVTLTGDGRVLALTPFEGRVYSTRGGGLEHTCTFPGPGHDVVSLLHVGPGELAVLSPNGRVRSFRLPSE